MVTVTTEGLRADGSPAEELPDVAWAIATGTVNAILASYDTPNTSLTDGLILGFRASGANTSTTPTFAPDGLTAHPITKGGGTALLAGDIPGNRAECLVRYNLANTRWELLNPYTPTTVTPQWGTNDGTGDAITVTYSPAITTLTDGLLLGFRAGAENSSTAPTFSPNGLTAHPIVRDDRALLRQGDIGGTRAEHLVRYDLANTQWVLLNPARQREFLRALSADDTGGQNVSTAQPWFSSSGSVAVESGATYEIEGVLHLSRTAGTTSHNTSLLFGGTATVASIDAIVHALTGDAAVDTLAATNTVRITATTAIVVKATSTSATEQVLLSVRGILRISAGGAGTFIPQFKYSTAPGGAPTIKRNSYFRLRRLGNSTVTTIGDWS